MLRPGFSRYYGTAGHCELTLTKQHFITRLFLLPKDDSAIVMVDTSARGNNTTLASIN